MADPTLSEFIARFPEFAAITQGRYDAALLTAKDFVSEAVFGTRYATAVSYYVAHTLTITDPARGGSKGAVTSERVGDLARSYAAGSQTSARDMNATSYGAEYLRIRNVALGGGGLLYAGA